MAHARLETTVGPLTLRTPLMAASGTFGFAEEYEDFVDFSKVGAVVTKTITLHHRSGNPVPRTWETTGGMLNAIGLENPGVDYFIRKKYPYLETLDTTVIVNIAGETPEDYGALAAKLTGLKKIAAIELNVSCPNVKEGGLTIGTDPDKIRKTTEIAKHETPLPVIVKLSPNVTDITMMAQAAIDGGADALSLVNTLLGMAVTIEKQQPALANVTGGLSGPCIKPVALRMVYEVARAFPKTPVIGIGGISQYRDVVEFMLAGACAVQIGTWNFIEPGALVTVADDLAAYLDSIGEKKAVNLIGALKTE